MLSVDLSSPFHVADIVPELNDMSFEEVLEVVPQLSDQVLIELLENNEFEYALKLLQVLIQEKRSTLLESLAEDRATHLFLQLNSADLAAANYLLSPKTRASILKLMSYPEFTAGHLLTTEFIDVAHPSYGKASG